MQVNQAEILISAVKPSQYPDQELPEIALAGRSNVGKSSFINRLINRKALARTSSKPGKTQTLNFYEINHQFRFVDVPGYGYAKVSKKEREKWGPMIETYLTKRENLQLVFLVIDFRHPPSKDDQQMLSFIQHYGLPYRILLTKIDKVTRNKRNKHLNQIKKAFNLQAEEFYLLFSAQTGEGREAVWQVIEEVL